MDNPSTADFAAWLRRKRFFLGQHTLQYASLKKFCAPLPVTKLDGRPALLVNNAGQRVIWLQQHQEIIANPEAKEKFFGKLVFLFLPDLFMKIKKGSF